MKWAFVFSFFLLLSPIRTIAQNNFPPVYEISADTSLIDTLPNKYWQILEDKNGKLTLNEVSKSPLADKFHYDTAEKINFQIANFWFRFGIKNTSDHLLKIGFYEDLKAVSDWYYTDTNGSVTHKTSGTETPWSNNESIRLPNYIIPDNFFPLTLAPGQAIMIHNRAYYNYFNFNLPYPAKFFIRYGPTDRTILENYVTKESYYFNTIHSSVFIGIMLLAAVLNFFFYLIVRERKFIYFSLYVFFLGLGRFIIDGQVYHIFMREHPRFYLYLVYFLWPFALFFLTLFIQSLLNTKKYYPRWDKFIGAFNYVNSIAFLASYFLNYFLKGTNMWGIVIVVNQFLSTVLYISLLATFFLFLRNNTFFDRRFLFAILPAFAIWFLGDSNFNFFQTFKTWLNFQSSLYESFSVANWHIIESICLIWQVLCFSWLLFHRFVELRKEVIQKELEKEVEKSQLIAQQKVELEKQVAERTAELKQSINELKETQAQLIQSEKMASLGELTAGIAHEIQNPLNFVNNFSEVNNELIEELKSKKSKLKSEEQDEMLDDIFQNNEKIILHGKRADSIVKGMLQHSRTSTGQKEMTDLNALCDEYLRLAYHGVRAKDKLFNTVPIAIGIKANFDSSIGKISVVPQDIGRVILNLINNAFYAVSAKAAVSGDSNYEPTVTVSTRRLNAKIEISVKDNGNGIPDAIKEKIFQPFFTTKPTGQGTGLGLSLAYDIVKAHGGEIKVKTIEGKGAEFIIELTNA